MVIGSAYLYKRFFLCSKVQDRDILKDKTAHRQNRILSMQCVAELPEAVARGSRIKQDVKAVSPETADRSSEDDGYMEKLHET